jgi:hypothetical protein
MLERLSMVGEQIKDNVERAGITEINATDDERRWGMTDGKRVPGG